MKLNPYINFNGSCAEAMTFYATVLGGEAQISTYEQMPPNPDMPPLSDEDKTKVMFSQLDIGGKPFLFADDKLSMFGAYQAAQGIQVTINVDSVAEGKRIFDAFADGGHVQLPYGETFWAKGFGMVTDRFGTPWMINAEYHWQPQ